MSAVDRLLETAIAEEGYLEKASNNDLDDKTANAGSNNYTKYARDLDNIGNIYNGKKQGYAWCDVFVDWCFITTFGVDIGMKLLCQSYSGAGAGCTYSAQYYKNKGQLHTSGPQPGDQIFFTNDGGSTCNHTGIVTKVTSSEVYTIEGNTSSASGVVANGGCVRQKSYSLSYTKIYGYGRPDWTLAVEEESYTTSTVNYEGLVTASTLNCRKEPYISATIVTTYKKGTVVIITKESSNGWGYTGEGWVSLTYIDKIAATDTETTMEEDEDMTDEKFAELMETYIQNLAAKDADWEASAMEWAQQQGLMLGDENGRLMPKKFMTRGEFATVMQRYDSNK